MKIKTTKDRQKQISLRQRKRISGTAERPRLRVFRSVAHLRAGDRRHDRHDAGVGGERRAALKGGGVKGRQHRRRQGKATVAERLIAKGIKRVVFDRSGFLYHGRIRA